MLLDELESGKVFYFFSEISKIPHGSGNTEALARYCVNFADERGFKSYRDEYGNIMIFKDGTSGYKHSESVILQGHLDMVCEKSQGCNKDMEQEGIDIIIDGEYMHADGTTLGGDDGIAIAYILALLDDDSIEHPPIEALFTTDEEIGLRGANELDASRLSGRKLINIDSEEEGVITASCAGAIRISCKLPLIYENAEDGMCAVKITAGGFIGGHSGIDIGKERKNAAKILAEFLYEVDRHIRIAIAGFVSGERLNVIPSSAESVICIKRENIRQFDVILAKFNAWLKEACAGTEPNALVTAADTRVPERYISEADSRKMIMALINVPNGILAMNQDIPFMVQTSSNLGSVSVKDGQLNLGFMIRSNTNYGKTETVRQLRCLIEGMGGEMAEEDDYPAWEYKHTSALRDVMVKTYEEMYGKEPLICTIHAGLECGILAEKLDGADMVSIGPNMKNVHTPDEKLEIKSVQRCWQYLLQVLKNLK